MIRRNLRLFSISRACRAEPLEDLSKIDGPPATTEARRAQHEVFTRIFDTAMANLDRKNDQAQRNVKLSSSLNQLFQPSPKLVSSSVVRPSLSAIADGSFLNQQEPLDEGIVQAFEEINNFDSLAQVQDYFHNVLVANFSASAKNWGSQKQVSPKRLQYLLAGCLERLFAIRQPMAAFNLFNAAKNQPRAIADAACAERTYNIIILALWEYFRDLKMVVDTVSEMSLHAGAGNSRTAAILHTITSEALGAKRGKLKRYRLPLWTRQDEVNCDILLNHRRCIVDVLSARAGLPQTTFLV